MTIASLSACSGTTYDATIHRHSDATTTTLPTGTTAELLQRVVCPTRYGWPAGLFICDNRSRCSHP